jgi:hypothetical protein
MLVLHSIKAAGSLLAKFKIAVADDWLAAIVER